MNYAYNWQNKCVNLQKVFFLLIFINLGTDVSVKKLYGQTDFEHNLKDITSGCDILCATPGRLMHILSFGREPMEEEDQKVGF